MLVLAILIAFAPLMQSVSCSVREVQFQASARFGENLVYSDYLLFDSPARSKLNCMVLCTATESCVRASYTGKTGTVGRCRGHYSLALSSDQGKDTLGTTTYDWTGELTNVALNKTATQSSLYKDREASRAVDGDGASCDGSRTCSHSSSGQTTWWQVDLCGDICSHDIFSVVITSYGSCCSHQPFDVDILVYAEDPATNSQATATLCVHYDGPMGVGETEELVCTNGPIRGRFVRMVNSREGYIAMCEFQVMAPSV